MTFFAHRVAYMFAHGKSRRASSWTTCVGIGPVRIQLTWKPSRSESSRSGSWAVLRTRVGTVTREIGKPCGWTSRAGRTVIGAASTARTLGDHA